MFTIAIVGRPNVGKSTLFNRLTGRRAALVDDAPGVTRDRREAEGRLGDLRFKVIDTAGLEEAGAATLAGRMLEQTKRAIEAADVIFFLIDARAGLTPVDRSFAELVRRAGKSVIVVANKCEGRAGEAGRLEGFALGLGDPVGISAEHNEGMSDLSSALREVLPEYMTVATSAEPELPAVDASARPVRVAVVGRPNVGKSTLINQLVGEERLLTGPEAGITRDAIEVPFTWRGHKFLLYDTAGMRRRPKVQEKLEKLSVGDALNSIRFAEVVVLLVNAEHPFEEQDQRIADLVEREGRALVMALGKWDLAAKPGLLGKLREEAERSLAQLKGMPLVGVSGLTGEGLDRLMQAIVDAHAVWNKRVPTPALNDFLARAISENPPPAVSGRTLKLNYITQPKVRPPNFVLFCTRADKVPDSYLRYLVNGLRAEFDLPGTPIRITLREKKNPYAGRKRR